jgi:copper homeostasis protein
MLIDIKKIKRLGIKEIVLGALDRNNSIDLNLMQVFSNEASPMSITFHKAIDFTYDIKNEIKKLSKFKNVKSILTSGGATTAEKGKNKLKEIIDTFEGRFHVIIAGSVTKNNLNELHAFIKGKEYHGRKIV